MDLRTPHEIRARFWRRHLPPAVGCPVREIGRRTDVVGIFPNDRSLIRLAASIVIEQNDEWLIGRRYLSNHSLDAVLDQETREDRTREETRELTAA